MTSNPFSIYRNLPSGWDLVPLGYLCREVKNKNSNLEEKNLLSLSYGRIVRKDIDTLDGLLPASFDGYNILNAGDIVLRLTDLQNDKKSLRTGLVTERGIITSAYTTIRPVGVDSVWLFLTLYGYDVQKVFYSLGSGLRQSMGFEDLKSLPVAVPPLDEQRRIATYLQNQIDTLNSLSDATKLQVQQLLEMKNSMIASVITGDVSIDELWSK